MKISLFALLVMVSLLPDASHAQTAEEMVSSCKDLSNAKVTDGRVGLPLDFDSGVCWGSFAMVQEMIVMADVSKLAKNEGRIFSVCAPPESTRTQLIQVYEQYATRHPEHYHEDFWRVASLALREAFPCKG